jgi:hypothetical protein
MVAHVLVALADAGLAGVVSWSAGADMGRVSVRDHGREVAFIAIDRGRAKVLNEVRRQYGHGAARLPSHPLYPAPIEHPFVVQLLDVCATANDLERVS